MAKAKTAYACTECGGQTSKWQGQCPHCGVWNTLVETIAATPASRFQALAGGASVVRALSSVEAGDNPRAPTGIEEFDRVLGGGLVPGGVILLGGDPGIGKSTLLLQAAGIDRRFAPGFVRHRRGIRRSDRVARATPGTGQRRGRAPGRGAARGHRRRDSHAAAGRGRDRFDPDRLHRSARVGARQRRTSQRVRGTADEARQADGDHHHPGRSRN